MVTAIHSIPEQAALGLYLAAADQARTQKPASVTRQTADVRMELSQEAAQAAMQGLNLNRSHVVESESGEVNFSLEIQAGHGEYAEAAGRYMKSTETMDVNLRFRFREADGNGDLHTIDGESHMTVERLQQVSATPMVDGLGLLVYLRRLMQAMLDSQNYADLEFETLSSNLKQLESAEPGKRDSIAEQIKIVTDLILQSVETTSILEGGGQTPSDPALYNDPVSSPATAHPRPKISGLSLTVHQSGAFSNRPTSRTAPLTSPSGRPETTQPLKLQEAGPISIYS